VRAVLARRAGRAGEQREGFQEPGRYVLAAASLLAGGLAVSLVWLAWRAALAVPGVTSSLTQSQTVSGLDTGQIVCNLGRFVNVWDLTGARSYPLAVIASVLLLGSLLVALVVVRPREQGHTLALATAITVIVGPLLLVVVSFLTNGTYAPMEPRYGATLVPLECAVAASLWRTHRSLIAVGALVVSYHAVVFSVLLKP